MATAAAPQTADFEDPVENGARQVETTIRFVDPGDFVTRRYVRAGAEINTGTYSDHRAIVRDAMPIRDHFELDVHGFRIAVQPTAVQDFHDKAEVDRVYEREVEEHVRRLTGADKVVARGWMVRTSADLSDVAETKSENYQHTGGIQPPAGEAHVDLNTATAQRMAEFRERALVIQRKTSRPVQFEILEPARSTLLAWLQRRSGAIEDYAFPSRCDPSSHLSTRQYGRLVDEWVSAVGLKSQDYGTHSLRRTKAAMIYKQTGNLRAVQILLGHTKIESTVRYLGVDVEDALELAEATEV